jgi:hypothetical protein
MSRRFAFPHACLALLLGSTPALAAPGPHLSWDQCSADGQVANKSFACDDNAGSEALVVSYESPVARADRVGVEITLHITATGMELPSWWSVSAPGSCRPSALSSSLVGNPVSACVNPYGAVAAGGIASYEMGFMSPNKVRVRAAAAVPSNAPFAVGPGVEDFAMRLVLSHAQTVGSGACAGCDVRTCLGVGIISLVSTTFGDDIVMLGGSGGGGGAATVTWQHAVVLGYTVAPDRNGGFFANLECSPSGPNPAARSTWGAVKSLYR